MLFYAISPLKKIELIDFSSIFLNIFHFSSRVLENLTVVLRTGAIGVIMPLHFFALMVHVFLSLGTVVFAGSKDASLQIYLKSEDGVRNLGEWSFEKLSQALRSSSFEKDPLTGQVVEWQGIVLSRLLVQALDQLPLEQSASIDLIVLEGKTENVAIPRAFVNKYPFLLAYKRAGKKIEGRGPLYSIVPWTSLPKVFEEALPVEKFFVSSVNAIQLTNSKWTYGSFFLKRRSDPRAVRGERLFIQTCMGCHNSKDLKINQINRNLSRVFDRFNVQSHASVKGMPALKNSDQNALQAYFKVVELENSDH